MTTLTFTKQQEKSKYQSFGVYKKIIHVLLHTEGLGFEPREYKALEYMWNCTRNGLGATKASYESISEDMTKRKGKGYGYSVISKGFKGIEKHGLMDMEKDHNDKTGHRAPFWKIIKEPEIIIEFIKTKLPSFDTEKLQKELEALENTSESTSENTSENTNRRNAENPCDSKDQNLQKEGYKTNKTNKTNKLNNYTASLDTETENQQEKGQKQLISSNPQNQEKYTLPIISDELLTVLNGWDNFKKNWTSEEEQKLIAQYTQKGLNQLEVAANDIPEHRTKIRWILGEVYKTYGNEGEQRSDTYYYNTVAKSIRETLFKEVDMTEQPKQTKPKNPIRKELLPDWFIEDENKQQEPKQAKPSTPEETEQKKRELDELLAKSKGITVDELHQRQQQKQEQARIKAEAEAKAKEETEKRTQLLMQELLNKSKEEPIKSTPEECRAFINQLAGETPQLHQQAF